MKKDRLEVNDYGDVLAVAYDLERVSYEESGDYQGEYLAVLKDKDRLFYFTGYFGSCPGCDWLEDVRDWGDRTISYKDAVDYSGDVKPRYIVPIDRPLKFRREDYDGWKLCK